MKKIGILIFLTTMLLAFTNVNSNASDFVDYDMIKGTGTYAESTNLIQVEFEFKTDVNSVNNNLVLEESNGTEITIDEITALNDIGGKATRFKLELTTSLDKNKAYTLKYNSFSIDLDLDNNAPLISYTNKVKNDSSKYDEREKVYLVQQETRNIFEVLFTKSHEFDLSNYIRINVVDDRDGSLVDETTIENLPDIYKAGTYHVKVSITDSWSNTSSETFTFKVIESNDNTDLMINISTIIGVVVLITAGVIVYIKKFK